MQRLQCDEIWSFCYGKEKNVTEEQKKAGAGSLWTWTALDADSKLIVSYLCCGRDASWARSRCYAALHYWLMLTEGHLTRTRFSAMLHRIALLPIPAN